MTWFSSSVIFLLSWWMVFLALLPVGIKSQSESGHTEEGTDPGAPVSHNVGKKMLWAVAGALGVVGIAFVIAAMGVLQPPDVPWA